MKIEATARLTAGEEHLQLLDPVADSLHHALECATKARRAAPAKVTMALIQSIKDALTELKVVQDELEV